MYNEENYLEFKRALYAFDKEKAYHHIMTLLNDDSLQLNEIYEMYLSRSLSEIASNNTEQKIAIWQEHLISNIVRSIVECAYPLVLTEKNNYSRMDKTAVILCLEEEYHDIGARMVQDYFEIVGFNTYFIGANTPDAEIESALDVIKPDVLCISVTNYYHLSKLHKLIDKLHRLSIQKFKIAIGGYAIQNSSDVRDQIKVDFYLKSYEDILQLREVLS